MALEASISLSDVASSDNLVSRKMAASLVRAPPLLRDNIHVFLSMSKLHPEIHPAVLHAILARPASERRELLVTVSGLGPAPPPAPRQQPTSLSAMSTDSDEVWEDALEEQEVCSKTNRAAGYEKDANPSTSMADMEREAATCHHLWKRTRDLKHWTRYTELRRKIALQRRGPEITEPLTLQQTARWAQLELQKQAGEQRLHELQKRREKLRWTRHYQEQTRQHHRHLEQVRLQQLLEQLDQRQQLRRLQHMQRVQQLMQELAEDEKRTDKKPAVPPPARQRGDEDEFTHMWDDYSHWEKMMDDDDKENVPPVPSRTLHSQPDLIPTREDVDDKAMREIVAFEERKNFFEKALLAWNAQDDGDVDLHDVEQDLEPSTDLLQVAYRAWRAPTRAMPAF